MDRNGTVFYPVMSYIEKHLFHEFSMDSMAQGIYYSKASLMRKFKQETGTTINTEYNIQKVLYSIPYLMETTDSLLKIALQSGFHSLEYYSETFKKYTGLSPMVFRKLTSQGDEETLYLIGSLIEKLSANKKRYEKLKTTDEKILLKN